MASNSIKREILTHYKKEFYLWLGAVLLLGISLSLSIKEYKKLRTNLQSQTTIEASYYRLSKEIIQIKEGLQRINLQENKAMITIPFDGTYDLREINRTIQSLKSLTQSDDRYLVLKELKLIREKDNTPKLKITGEIIAF